jgi:hypothetical protein
MADFGTEKRREKVVVLRELQRAIIYTRELSKQAIENHVSTAVTVYSVNESARLTANIRLPLRREIRLHSPRSDVLHDVDLPKHICDVDEQ